MTIQEIKKELSAEWNKPKPKNAKGKAPRNEERVKELLYLKNVHKEASKQPEEEDNTFTGIV